MSQRNTHHTMSYHRLVPDREQQLRDLVVTRGMPTTCALLSTSEPTVLALLSIGVRLGTTRDRVERYLTGIMRSAGLVPTPAHREPDAPPRVIARESENDRVKIHVKSENVLTEWEGICAGQVWVVTEPSGREVRVRITHIIRDGHHGARAHGRTPSGRKRAVLADTLRKGMYARLIEAAPAEARSA